MAVSTAKRCNILPWWFCFWLVVAICLKAGQYKSVAADSVSTGFRNHLAQQQTQTKWYTKWHTKWHTKWYPFWNKNKNKPPTNFNFHWNLHRHHSYFAIRHGQSKANVQKIIASDPTVATKRFGLSKAGKRQARAAGNQLLQAFLKADPQPDGICIVSSDFLRAVETAEELAKVIVHHNKKTKSKTKSPPIRLYQLQNSTDFHSINNNIDCVQLDLRLRERFFGEYERTSDANYPTVWREDLLDPYHTIAGVESVWSVLDRVTSLVADCERGTSHKLWIVLVAHGDVLQILQTGLCNRNPKDHRSLPHLETATLRPLQ